MVLTLISKTAITSDAPEAHDYELTIKFRMTTFGQPLPSGVATLLANVMDDYSDGRLPFEVEMIFEGLNNAMKQAIWHNCQKIMQAQYGNEMVQTGDRSQTAKWYLEAQKLFKTAVQPMIHQCPQIKIEKVQKTV